MGSRGEGGGVVVRYFLWEWWEGGWNIEGEEERRVGEGREERRRVVVVR